MSNDDTLFEEHEDFGLHGVGNTSCQKGWCGCWGYPKPCACGGLVHAEYEDEDYDNVYLNYKCDRCNSTANPG